MALKSMSEIAFDAFQTFADPSRLYYTKGNRKHTWKTLPPDKRMVWDRVANRVYAEVLLRQKPDQKTVAMPDLDKDHE